MDILRLDISAAIPFVDPDAIEKCKTKAAIANKSLYDKTGKGNDFLGWVTLPANVNESDISEIESVSQQLREISDIVIVIGIGGSYLGAKAVIESLGSSFDIYTDTENPKVIFAGHHLDEDYLSDLLNFIKTKRVSCIVISKSGTTTEPAVTFRLVKQHIETTFGKEGAKDRIVAITDHSRGALRKMSEQEGYKTFAIPDDVGGRFSVLTPVGLLPISVAGFDIRILLKGATDLEKVSNKNVPVEKNICAQYAIIRNILYGKGKKIEILANYNPKLHYLTEWWKQLFGESEGKEGKGIFPAGVDFTSDLHSMGQYIQDGERILFETVISIEKPYNELFIPEDTENLDQLNFLAGKRIGEVNKMAELGTMLAHVDGGVPNIRIEIPELDTYFIGQLIYFFEKACGISGYLLDVNPFDQPGVEAYKKNMFALLGKAGFESEGEQLRKRLVNNK
ncbi:MAG: glucose-6-phosphate isomerase [Prevotellaceae bacterium]|jgi:glucose-6-phosphate isomerase|nr:glucose-6-phosphate isomerase [Prevotellaceae bacterium]